MFFSHQNAVTNNKANTVPPVKKKKSKTLLVQNRRLNNKTACVAQVRSLETWWIPRFEEVQHEKGKCHQIKQKLADIMEAIWPVTLFKTLFVQL